MNVLSFEEDFQARDAGIDKTFKRTLTRRFVAVTDSDVTPNDMLDYYGPTVPYIMQPYPSVGTLAWCTAISIKPRSNAPNCFDYVATYSADFGQPKSGGPGNNANGNPTFLPTRYSGGQVTFTELFTRDVAGRIVLNSAGQKFDPPPETERKFATLKVSRYEADFPLATQNAFTNKVNNDDFYLFGTVLVPAGIALMSGISYNDEWVNGVRYWNTTYDLVFRDDGVSLSQGYYGTLSSPLKAASWNRFILDQGWGTTASTYEPGSGVAAGDFRVGVRDIFGNAPVQQINLDGKGGPLPKTATDPVFLLFLDHDYVPFAPLLL